MSANNSYFSCIPLVVFNTATLTGSFQSMNGTGFPDTIKMLKYYNGSNVGVTISYDGVTAHDYFPAGSTFILDLQANHADNSTDASGILNGRIGQKIYGTGTGVGNFYISGYR